MSSDNQAATWDILQQKMKQEINSFPTQNALAINHKEFVKEFVKAFRPFRKGQVAGQWSPILHSRLMGSYNNIRTIVEQAILSSGQMGYLRPRLNPLIWEVGSLLLERAFKAGIEAHDLVDLMEDFNMCVPRMSELTPWEVINHLDKDSLRKPFQDMFTLYMEFYISVVRLLETSFDKGKTLAKDPGIRSLRDQAATKMNEVLIKYQDEEYSATAELRDKQTNKGLYALRRDPEDLPKERFEEICIRGGGSSSWVHEVKQVQTGKKLIRKRMRKAIGQGRGTTKVQFENEFAIMKKLCHEHITSVQFWRDEGENFFSLFMLPIADCDLWDYLHNTAREGFPRDRVEKIYPWFGCLLHALDYAHGMNIKHQDIKPTNILICNADPYLTDFGMAEDVSELEQSKTSRPDIGTPTYRAPEDQSGRAADIFSLGCVYSEMLTVIQGKGMEDFQIFRRSSPGTDGIIFKFCLPKVIEWIQQLATKDKDGLANTVLKLVEWMLKEEPGSRPKAGEAMQELRSNAHFWCQSHKLG